MSTTEWPPYFSQSSPITIMKHPKSIQKARASLSEIVYFLKSNQAETSLLVPKARRAKKYLEKHLGLLPDEDMPKKKRVPSPP